MFTRVAAALIMGLAACQITSATPVPEPQAEVVTTGPAVCTKPVVRKEWRFLTDKEKSRYIAAVQCLLTKPAKIDKAVAPAAKNRYDDFIAAHSLNMQTIHFVGQFLPYHRYILASYEKVLREECCYNGAQPYWDWALDAASEETFLQSPVFDPETGFGGNGPFIPFNASDPEQPSAPLGDVVGRTGGGCITDGPFKSRITTLGPGPDLSGANKPQCLRRDFSPSIAVKFWTKAKMDETLNQPDYTNFNIFLDGREDTGLPPNFVNTSIHTGGHWAVGGSFGQITDLFISPSDPLFWLHHANLDRVFWSWQARKLPQRLTDMGGPVVFADYDYKKGGQTTLDYVLDVGTVNAKTTVGQTMDIKGGTLCYDYDKLL